MEPLKTIAAIVGVVVGALSLSWGTALTIGRNEVAIVRGELEGFRRGSDQVHAAQDQRFSVIADDARNARTAAQAAAEDSAATRAVVEQKLGGVRQAKGGR